MVLVFHLAFIVILVGAAITRFISYEGTMHIREQAISNTMLSTNGYVFVELEAKGQKVESEKEVMITDLTPKGYRMSTRIGGEKVKVRSTAYMSNAMEQWVSAPGGSALSSDFTGKRSTEFNVGLPSGESRSVLGMNISFNNNDTTAMLRFVSEGDRVFLYAPFVVTTMQMGGGIEIEYPAWETVPVTEGKLYGMGQLRLALQGFLPSAAKQLVKAPPGEMGGYPFGSYHGNKVPGMISQVMVPGLPRMAGVPVSGKMGDLNYSITYGSKELTLPFSLFLKDFQVERYPGSNSPSSFASEVVLVDKEMGIQEDRRIFMNNVLKHRGFRFYQSSYDNDEKGTILSVNKDLAGTFVTYLGYLLLIAGMMLAMFVKNTRFCKNCRKDPHPCESCGYGLLFLGMGVPAFSQQVPPKEVAEQFGKLWVQDKGGRYEPMNTLSVRW